MLDKLTPEQVSLMQVVRDEWLAKIFNPEKRLKIDREKVKESIEWLYTFSKIHKPKYTIFVDSPMAIQMAVWLLKSGKLNPGDQVRGQVSGQAWDQIWGQVRGQARGQVSGQVWDQVWDQVRGQVSGQVWDQVRGQVSGQVRGQASGQVSGQVWDQVGGQVRGQVRDQVWDQVRGQVSGQVRGQVRDQVSGQVRDQVRGQVWGQARDQVWDQVWDQVGGQVRGQYEPFSYYGNIGDYGWCSFYDYFSRIGIVKHENFDKFLNLLDSGIYDMVVLEDACIVCPMPTKISRTEVRGEQRLHSTEGFAIEWPDGYGQNYLWGFFFPDNLWQKVTDPNVKGKDILEIENMEQRMAALKYIDAEKMLKALNAKLVSSSLRGNWLYKIENVFNQTAYFLKYTDPSTNRIYISGIDPEIGAKGDADLAMAWKHGMSAEQYAELKHEA